MADRYWVGGTAAWDNTAGTKWATTSGGAGGAAVPTSADSVYFDANSGAVTVTLQGGYCRNLTATGFTGTLTGTSSFVLYVYGNIALATTHTYSAQTTIYMPGTGVARSIYSAGHNIPQLSIYGAGTVALQADLNVGYLGVSYGATFDAADYNVTVQSYVEAYGSSSTVGTLKLGSGTWTLLGTTTLWDVRVDGAVESTAASKIVIASEGTGTKSFRSIYTSFAGTIDVQGSSVCTYSLLIASVNTLKYSKSVASTISLLPDATTSVSQWLVSGTAGNLVKLTGRNTYLNYTGVGKVSADYLDIAAVMATPNYTWYAGTHSVDSGGNTGWTFSDPPVASSIGFFACSF